MNGKHKPSAPLARKARRRLPLLAVISLAAPTLDILGLPYVLLEAASLPPGPYLLAISHGQPNTELKLFLPAGATSTGAMTAEEYLQKYLPATSEGDGWPVSAPTAVTLVNHRANHDRFEFGRNKSSQACPPPPCGRIPAGLRQHLENIMPAR